MVDFTITPARPQVVLKGSPFRQGMLPDGTCSTLSYRTDAGYLLRFPDLADFEISADGQAVTCCPTPETSDATARHLYLNQVLPLVLGQLGNMVFHASAVAVEGVALAFVAESTAGKSTLATSFAAAGSLLLTDESLMLDERASGYWVAPGHRSVRLWEDSERALVASGVDRAPSLPLTSKQRLLAGESLPFADSPTLLRRMYYLGGGRTDVVSLDRMEAADVLLELLKASFLLNVDDRSRLASHFDDLARLAHRPIHFRLDFPRRFDFLPAVRRSILEHAQLGSG
jgi:hypothetical protein